MPGTKEGGAKAAATSKLRYGDNFYGVIGSKGGKAKVPKGFAVTGLASKAGKIGGRKSRK